MATSGSSNFYVTRDDIIKSALRKVNGLGLWESPSTEATAAAALSLNVIAKRLMAMNMPIWKTLQTDIAGTLLTTSQVQMGVGQAVDVPKPMKLFHAEWNMDDVDTQLRIVDRQTFMRYAHLTVTGTPHTVYFQPLRASTLIILYPYLNTYNIANGTLKLQYSAMIEDFDTATDEPDFPVEWAELLIYELAVNLAPEYALPMGERSALMQERQNLRELVGTFDIEEGSLYLQPNG